jgi:ribosomal protein S18 acetylase RimI-like enzyme
VTVREYRRGDSVGVADLWRRNPSMEFPLLGFHPDTVGAVLRRTERPGVRFLLGLARAFRRPIFVMLIAEAGDRLVGTTLLSFTPEAGYVSGVVVDASVRRQGHARAMLQASDDICRRYRRPHVVLDVLAENAPARQLYDAWGYRSLREERWLVRPLGSAAPLPPRTDAARVRPLRRGDAARLAAIENAQMSPEVRSILPRHASEFRVPVIAESLLDSETESWVLETDDRPVGFLRATVSTLMEAAHLSSPVLDLDVAGPAAQELLVTALRWIEARKAPRVLSQVADHQARRLSLWMSLGFVERFRVHTLAHRLSA